MKFVTDHPGVFEQFSKSHPTAIYIIMVNLNLIPISVSNI